MRDRPGCTLAVRFYGPWLAIALAASALAAGNEPRPLSPDLVGARWPAYWIASPNAPATAPCVFNFHRELMLANVPDHFWVHASADSRFLLHVNGEYAAEGPPPGQDVAIASVKMYGTGRVFYSSLGHTKEAYNNPEVRYV